METAALGFGLHGYADTRQKAAVEQDQKKRSNYNNLNEHATDRDDHDQEEAGSDDQQHKELAISFKILQDGELESAKAEMRQVMEENQRLKSYLEQAMEDYRALQMKFYEFAHKESKDPTDNNPSEIVSNSSAPRQGDHDEAELVSVSLSLGRPSGSCMDTQNKSRIMISNSEASPATNINAAEETKEESGLPPLGLDRKYDMASQGVVAMNSRNENSFHEPKDEAVPEMWSPSKILKNAARSNESDDDVVQQPPVKKPRVCVRARCDTPTMNDGCQWRKYGQKIAKGNPCPRAYYRCTVAPSCPVRKQVQRCAEDMSILITTYEGTHNHPLPISATAMASTTSAAAYMLMSGSSTSSGPGSILCTTTPPAVGLHNGINFSLPDDSRSSKAFFLPTSSSITPSPSHPTITLDLTSSAPPCSSSQLIGRPTSSIFAPRFSSTNLTFNSSEPSTNSLPMNWPNGSQLGNTSQPLNNRSHVIVGSAMSTGRNPQYSICQTLFQKGGNMTSNPGYQATYPDTIAAAARALTSDPSFHSVLTAALSSFIGGGGGNSSGTGGDGNMASFSQRLKAAGTDQATDCGPFDTTPAASALAKGNITGSCGTSFLGNAPSTTNPPPSAGSLMFVSSPFPASKSSSSASSGDNKDQAKR